LVSITADNLRQHVNRGPVEAKVVMAIDAVGPRTAATAIVAADGRMLHSEDLPCQLSASQRSQTVSRMGELIHAYHVDLIVVSNGPARRATMIALIEQSPERTVRWTLADRSGADAYASSSIANDEMRSTPRRFRAAAWLAFAVLQPAQALAKVDPLKLRLSSFQRELSDDALSGSLRDVMISGASRGGVDANSAPVSWLSRLPGVTTKVATAIDVARRGALFSSRTAVGELEQWESAIHRRQAIPFLRVFGSEEVLDGTLIHPEDYALAKKLAAALGIELPPAAPPGYAPPDYASRQETAAPPQLADSTAPPAPMEVKDFTAAGESVSEFVVEGASPAEGATDPVAPLEAAAEPEMSVAEPAQPAQAEPPQEASSAVAASEAGEALSHETAPADAPQPSAPSLIPDPIRRPRPERVKIDKCIKEWQIGARRAEQLVQWLCDPFGDSDSTGSPPAVLSTMPTAKALKPGDQVIGVIVGVMPFGVFVELAPDCSGLVHVSRVSDSFVEDLHEAVQVGDVITAWVSGVDDKRRRVALSAVSPEREAEMEAAKRLVQEERHPRGGPRRRPEHAQAPATGQSRGGETRADRGPQGGEGQARTGQARGGQARGGQARAGQSQVGPGSRRGPSGGGEQAGGRPREASRGGRSRDRDSRGGARRDKKPESYRVVSKQEATPITDAMQKGEEPLRSFGDLLQFFGKKTVPARPKPGDSEAAPPETAPPDAADSGDLANSAVQQAVAAADAEPRVTAAVSQSQPAPADTDAGPPAQPAPPEDATAR
jgi:predicted RNA-binding protein with RPS1 domain